MRKQQEKTFGRVESEKWKVLARETLPCIYKKDTEFLGCRIRPPAYHPHRQVHTRITYDIKSNRCRMFALVAHRRADRSSV